MFRIHRALCGLSDYRISGGVGVVSRLMYWEVCIGGGVMESLNGDNAM